MRGYAHSNCKYLRIIKMHDYHESKTVLTINDNHESKAENVLTIAQQNQGHRIRVYPTSRNSTI